jgi:hypothetical protein
MPLCPNRDVRGNGASLVVVAAAALTVERADDDGDDSAWCRPRRRLATRVVVVVVAAAVVVVVARIFARDATRASRCPTGARVATPRLRAAPLKVALYPHTTTTTAVASVRARVVERARCAVR